VLELEILSLFVADANELTPVGSFEAIDWVILEVAATLLPE